MALYRTTRSRTSHLDRHDTRTRIHRVDSQERTVDLHGNWRPARISMASSTPKMVVFRFSGSMWVSSKALEHPSVWRLSQLGCPCRYTLTRSTTQKTRIKQPQDNGQHNTINKYIYIDPFVRPKKIGGQTTAYYVDYLLPF